MVAPPTDGASWAARRRSSKAGSRRWRSWGGPAWGSNPTPLRADPSLMERHWTSRLLHRVGAATAHSGAGAVAALAVAGWIVVGAFVGFRPWWQTVLYAVTSTMTFVMVFVIQHTQSRQTSATQRKLDELLRASHDADPTYIAAEDAPDEDLELLAEISEADRRRAHAQALQQNRATSSGGVADPGDL